jgi:hypothetical protein
MADQDPNKSPAEFSHRIGAKGRLSLNNVSGDIRIRGVEGEEARVVARWDGHRNDPLPLVINRGDGYLDIETDDKSSWFSFRHGSIEFTIDVPFYARVDINAVSADIESRGLTGDQSYKTVSGDLVIDRTGGRVSAVTVSGDVTVSAVTTAEVNVSTTSGDVDAYAEWFEPVRVKTVSGDMRVRGRFARGPQHTVESVSGDLEIEAMSGLSVETKRGIDLGKKDKRPIVSGDGSANLRFRSLSGDVRLSGFSTAQPDSSSTPSSAVTESHEPGPPPSAEPAQATEDSLEVLRALERGEIDVEEASRRLEGAASRG